MEKLLKELEETNEKIRLDSCCEVCLSSVELKQMYAKRDFLIKRIENNEL